MITLLITFLLAQNSFAEEPNSWAVCEKALDSLQTEIYRIVDAVDRSKHVAELNQHDQLKVKIPAGLVCSTSLTVQDMPVGLRDRFFERIQESSKQKIHAEAYAALTVNALLVRAQEATQKVIDAKTKTTIETKLRGELDDLRTTE